MKLCSGCGNGKGSNLGDEGSRLGRAFAACLSAERGTEQARRIKRLPLSATCPFIAA